MKNLPPSGLPVSGAPPPSPSTLAPISRACAGVSRARLIRRVNSTPPGRADDGPAGSRSCRSGRPGSRPGSWRGASRSAVRSVIDRHPRPTDSDWAIPPEQAWADAGPTRLESHEVAARLAEMTVRRPDLHLPPHGAPADKAHMLSRPARVRLADGRPARPDVLALQLPLEARTDGP